MRKLSAIFMVVLLCVLAGVGLGYEPATSTEELPHWLPPIHQARLIDYGALDFVERNITGIEPGTGWVDVITGIAYLDIDDSTYMTCALIHEASHVQQYKDGLQYYGSHAEAMADHATGVFCPDWVQRMPWQIPDNGPVNGNPE